MLDIPRRLAEAALPALLCLLCLAPTAPVEAQMLGIMDYFGGQRRWAGERMHPPAPTPRPDLPIVARSPMAGLAIHAGPGVSEGRADEALEALELAHDALARIGFTRPPPDGGRGGSDELDLYLMPGDGERADDAKADPLVLWSYLDSAPAFATVDAELAGAALAPCVTSAYAQAVLIGQDPAEAITWRRATAAYLTWLVTGSWGCDEDRIVAHQRAPHLGWVSDDGDGDGGALLLAELSSRHDRGTGRFVHDVWQIARQRTWDRPGLRASPDLWEAIDAALEVSQRDELDALVEDLAVARYFTGSRAGGPMVRRWARSLPDEGVVPVSESFDWSELSKYTRPHEPEIEPFGSAYVEVDVQAAEVGERLRLWLRGEFGVRWSFVAVSLDAEGRELNRVAAPPRRLTRSYLQIDFTDDTVKKVLVVVTNLSARLPDADAPDDNARSFRVILDHGE